MDINKFKELMCSYADKIDIVFDDKQFNQFYEYMHLLLKWNKKINLTAIKGNWALVSVYDIDKTPKTGYLRWRSDEGVIYAFPNIK